jgi:hypothetical protein
VSIKSFNDEFAGRKSEDLLYGRSFVSDADYGEGEDKFWLTVKAFPSVKDHLGD